jgi:SAM-dependent methyltransferase
MVSGVEQAPHQHRAMAESFGADAERYDRARPRYPDDMVKRIVEASPGPDFVDVGCGTGIATRQFAETGCRVLGVDVDARMVEQARRNGFEAEVAKFESWDPAGRTFDSVVAGQTWHWVDPVAGADKAAQVLRPGGLLALFWNVFRPASEVAETFCQIHLRVLPDAPRNPWARPALDAYSVVFDKVTGGIEETGAFGPLEQWRLEWEHTYTRDDWLDQLPTHGDNSQLPEAKLDELLAAVGAAIDRWDGSFAMGYTTVVLTAEKTSHRAGA